MSSFCCDNYEKKSMFRIAKHGLLVLLLWLTCLSSYYLVDEIHHYIYGENDEYSVNYVSSKDECENQGNGRESQECDSSHFEA